MRVLRQCRRDNLTGMPGGVVDDQNHTRILRSGITGCDLAEVLGEGALETPGLALAGAAVKTCATTHRLGVKGGGDDIDRRKDVEHVLAIPGADDGTVALNPQC